MVPMSRIAPLSGFPEWSPAERVVEREILALLARTFELHGFANIETRAVEPVSRLAGDSDAAKEIYAVKRLGGSESADAELGLHFDLTVPLARYVEENVGSLAFPFRRYQIQKVWRGERPQEGRFREFYQADIDVVGRDRLASHHEVEVAVVMARALAALPIPPVRMLVNNRKLVEGFYLAVGITDVAGALRSIDKLDKIGAEGVATELRTKGIAEPAIEACLALAAIATPDASFAEEVRQLASRHDGLNDQLEDGIAELSALVAGVNAAVPGVAVADLRIARGLDYYTGSVFETFVVGQESLGSICSGGRYDNLVSAGGSAFPGVGMSVGVSRLVSRVLGERLAVASRGVPSAVLVAVVDEATRAQSNAVADRLRDRGIACEVAPSADKFGKQIQYADRRGIPFVWFPGSGGEGDQVKDIRSGEQTPADPERWAPPAEDLNPRVVRG